MSEIHGYCPLCISRCGAISTVEAGRLVKVRPDPEHPTGGSFCVKGRAAPELVHSDQRLLYPLMRTRPKGDTDPGWRRVSWDEALDFTAERIRQSAEHAGAESVVFGVTTPSGTAVADAFGWIHRLAHAVGSPNILFATENCNWHKDFGSALTFGSNIGIPDFDHTGCMLFWGFNPSTSWPAYARAATEAKRRGARLIVVDPRRAGLAGSADQWLAVRPGSDLVLALSIAGEMIENGWYDQDFIAHWSNGPLLVRSDDGRFMAAERSTPQGAQRVLMAWDARRQRTAAYDPVRGAYLDDPPDKPLLLGDVVLREQGREVRCRPAFQVFAECCAQYPPERAATLSGVPARQIRETARLLHDSGPVSFFHWAGICQQAEATQSGRAIGLLCALTGSFGAPGGNVRFAVPPLNDIMGFDLLPQDRLGKALGREDRPLGPPAKGWVTSRDFARAVLESEPYPVRGLLSFGANPLLTKPNTPTLDPALRALDFYVHADMFLNPTAQYADLVLPVASPWEREGLAAGFQLGERGSRWLQLRQPVLPPQGESRSDTAIVFALADRLGLGDKFFDADQRAGLSHQIAPTGIGLEELERHPEGVPLPLETVYRPYLHDGFGTPTKRIEIYSETLLDAGLAPIPEPGPDRLPLSDAYPLRLTTAKWPYFCHSQHHAMPSLRGKLPEPLVELGPELAERKGISEGDWVRIASAVGSMRARARITDRLAADTLCAQYGWWESCPELGLPDYAIDRFNYNALIDDARFDPASGSNAMRGYPCAIARVVPAQPPATQVNSGCH
ncbi:molybdopterin-dependent oxidoreductase [Thiorhodococcus mannitoliphagus]|uniref:Molybdopterin-dependent oxidoreductase n=1 Tax=Thiorhodococcus mannitoliphagus TaxID=329406 RepID=A0A6P1DQZ9_9GAMM|nr:molybdopterin-dependent oxidoreductase [Thiorhodococcus mannitoliphagus]NEX20687.1 molybdopterin-dependent oxidoreductase [Thiorhodococcus mannitoliphagus]